MRDYQRVDGDSAVAPKYLGNGRENLISDDHILPLPVLSSLWRFQIELRHFVFLLSIETPRR